MRLSQFLFGNNTRQVLNQSSISVPQPSRLIIQPQAVFTGTEAGAQRAQTVVASGLLIFTGTEAKGQALQTVAAAGKEIFTGTEAKAQASQTEADAGKLIFTGSASTSQRVQALLLSSGLVFGGSSSSSSQRAQTTSSSGQLTFDGSESGSQQPQSTSSAGQEVFIGNGSTAQAPQSTVGFESFSGTANTAQLAQTVFSNGTIPVSDAQMPYVGGGKRPHRRATLDLSAFLPVTIFGQSWTGSPQQKAAASGEVVLPPRMAGDYRTFQRKQTAIATASMLDQELEELTWLLMNV
jgi:hypothetical protein